LKGDYFSIFYKLSAAIPSWYFTSQIFNCDNTTFNNCKYTHIPNSKIHVSNFLSLSFSIFFFTDCSSVNNHIYIVHYLSHLYRWISVK
jgi:hypothetical protein